MAAKQGEMAAAMQQAIASATSGTSGIGGGGSRAPPGCGEQSGAAEREARLHSILLSLYKEKAGAQASLYSNYSTYVHIW